MMAMNLVLKSILLIGLAVILPKDLYAALNISVSVVDGGSTLELGTLDGSLDANKSVRIRVNTDDGRQYQVYQRITEPLVNQQGSFLNQQVIETYAVSGSNASGTLYAQTKETLGSSDQLVYTSTPDGQSDTLTLSYLVNQDRINSAGNYIGRIQFTVRSLGAGFQDQAIISVTVDAAAQWKSSVVGLKNADKLELSSSRSFLSEDGLKIEFSGKTQKEIQIYQELQITPQNEKGDQLPNAAVKVFVTGEGLKSIVNTPEGLSTKREMIYQSTLPSDQWVLHVQLNDAKLGQVKSGIYRGRLLITIDSPAGLNEFPISFDVEIKPIFEIEVVLPEQGVRFSKVLPTDPPQVKEVIVKVRSNTGKSYLVTQKASSGLVTPKGEQIKKEFFVFKTELIGETKGRGNRPDFTPVGMGEEPIYYSDRQGSSAEFKVLYRLSSYPEINAGDYGVPIVFSLDEM
jgi:hypothetical protein